MDFLTLKIFFINEGVYNYWWYIFKWSAFHDLRIFSPFKWASLYAPGVSTSAILKGLPSLDLRFFYYAKLFQGRGLLLGIFLSSLLSWSTESFVADMLGFEAVSHTILLQESWVHAIIRLSSVQGHSYLFLGTLFQSPLGPWLYTCKASENRVSPIVDLAVVL